MSGQTYLCGLIGLSYLVFPKFFKHLPFIGTVNERLVVPYEKNTVQNDKDKWSIQKAVAFNLNKVESVYAAIELVILAGLPYVDQSLGEYVDNKAGVEKARIIYAIKDIPENAIIMQDALEIKNMAKHRIPEDALRSTDEAVGHICKYGVLAGQIVSRHDISPLKQHKQK